MRVWDHFPHWKRRSHIRQNLGRLNRAKIAMREARHTWWIGCSDNMWEICIRRGRQGTTSLIRRNSYLLSTMLCHLFPLPSACRIYTNIRYMITLYRHTVVYSDSLVHVVSKFRSLANNICIFRFSASSPCLRLSYFAGQVVSFDMVGGYIYSGYKREIICQATLYGGTRNGLNVVV